MRELSDDEVFGTAGPAAIKPPALKGAAPGELSDADVFGTAPTADHWTDNLRDPLAGALKIGPTALKGVADIARLVTGDNVGVGLSNAMQEGMQSIDNTVGSERLRAQKQAVSRVLDSDEFGIGDIPGMVVDNPRAAIDAGVSTIGSMFLPTGVAAGAVRAAPTLAKVAPIIGRAAPGAIATGATIGTGAAMNAAETFADSAGGDMGDRYQGAALSGAASLALGKLFGGGAEGLVARRLAGEVGSTGAREIAKSVAKTAVKEGLQEFGEEGANTVGKQVAKDEDINLKAAAKQGAYGAVIGAGVGGASDVATNVGAARAQPPELPIDPAAPPVAEPATPRQGLGDRLDQLASRMEAEGKTDQAREYRVQAQAARELERNPEAMASLLREAQENTDAPAAPDAAPAQPEATGLKPKQEGPVLQNRDRSTPSSVAQMQSIAAAPDYGRLGFSRDFANGAPVVAGGQVAPEQMGSADVAVASDGRRIPVQYAVVEADSVLPSNAVDGATNAEYASASDRMRAIAGNGRIAGLQAAAQRGTDQAYRNELAADTLHGIAPEVVSRMRAPVLVRVMPQDQVTANIGDVSNTSGNLQLSAVEQANNDGRRVDLSGLEFSEDGGMTAKAVRQFVQGMPQAERGALLDTNGQPTKQAVDRLHAAVFSRAYGNDGLVRLYAQAQDPEARLILSALAKLAPKMARLEGAGALDIRGVVTQAAEIAVNARRNGTPLAQAAAQLDMAADPLVGTVLQLFARNPRSNREAIEQLGNVADLAYAEANKPDTDMFGPVERASRAQVMNQLEPQANERSSQENLEQPAGREPVPVDAGQPAADTRAAADPGPAQAGRPAQSKTGAGRAIQQTTSDINEGESQAQRGQDASEIEKDAATDQQQDLESDDPMRAEAPSRRYSPQTDLFEQTDAGQQIQMFLDSGPVESQAGEAAAAAQSAAAEAVADIHATETLLGLALSSDYAARQRATLVGQEVASHADLAVLAQVYRDPRFETFRLVFVNDDGKVVSQVGLSSRLPAAATAVVGSDVNTYLSEVSEAARNTGATGFYMLHNHPSGISAASNADRGLTASFAGRMPMLEFKDHVVIDTNEYTTIDRSGRVQTHHKDFGQPAPMTYGEWGGRQISGPDDIMAMAKQMAVDENAVTLITLDSQLRVKGVTELAASAVGYDRTANRRAVLKATLRQQGARVVAVGRDMDILRRLEGSVLDAVMVMESGAPRSLVERGILKGGELFPQDRRTRLSPDSSQAFDYLRAQTLPQSQKEAGLKVAEPGKGQKKTEAFKRWHAGSKVKGVVYHATAADFDTFDTSVQRSDLGAHFGTLEQANKIATGMRLGGRNGTNVMPVWLSIKNPLRLKDVGTFNADGIAVQLEKKGLLEKGEGKRIEKEIAADWKQGKKYDPLMREAIEAAGYDGVVYANTQEGVGDSYIAFKPEQIKSAIGNSGAFDPENPSIVAETGKQYRSTTGGNQNNLASAAAPWNVPEPGTGDAIIRSLQNNKIDLKRLRDTLQEQYGQLSDRADAYLNEELYHGKVAARVEALHKETVEPILGKIAVAGKNAGVTVDDVNLYLHARHAPERNAAMEKINPGMQNNAALSGMSDQQAASAIARLRADGKLQALQAIAADIDGLVADTRASLVADGLEDAAVVQAWESAYQHYVPLQRDVDTQGGGASKGMGFSVKGPEAKRAVGSNREVVNILANIVAQAETATIRAEKAKVGRSLLEMANSNPNPDFWTVDVPPTKPRINKDTGLVERNAVDPLYQTADNVVMVKDQGQVHYIVFNKHNERAQLVAHAMKNLDAAPMNKALTVVGHGTRFIASMLTARNPLFWFTNFARDIQGVMLNLEGTEAEGLQTKVMANLPGAFKGMHSLVRGDGSGQWARVAKEMQEAGGTTGYMQSFSNSDERMGDITKEVGRMQQGKADPRRLGRLMLDFIDDYNDIVENAVRLSAYKTARDAGASAARAASLAKNITVNFNRKGNLTPVINSLYMFFNASLQGTARLAQALATSRKAQAIVGGIAGMGFLLDVLNRMAAGEDDETGRNRYDLIPEYEKSKNWIFMNPMRPGEYVKVPLPLGPHVFHNAGRLVSDALNREDPRNAAEYGWAFAGTLFDAFSPLGGAQSFSEMVLPSVVDPIAQLENNKSFTGAPVYKSADRGFGPEDPKPAYTRYFESTPEVWKQASKLLNDVSGGDDVKKGAINIEPDILKHIAYTFTGGPGRTIDQAIDTAQGAARGKEVSTNRIPFVSRFYGTNDDKQRERIFYDDRKRVEEAKAQFNYAIKERRRDLAREIATELGDGDFDKGMKMMRNAKGTNREIMLINKRIKLLREREQKGDNVTREMADMQKKRTQAMNRNTRRNDDDGEAEE